MAKEAGSAADTKKYPLNLPDTPFPMRGNLPKREPEWIGGGEKKQKPPPPHPTTPLSNICFIRSIYECTSIHCPWQLPDSLQQYR